MDYNDIIAILEKNIETGKKLGLTTNGEKWWYIGTIQDRKTKKPVAFSAYYEPTDGITAGTVDSKPEDLINLPASYGVAIAARLLSVFVEDGPDRYEFCTPATISTTPTLKPGNTLVLDPNMSLEDTLEIMYAAGANNITGDARYGEWCKMTNSYVALKGNGKWFRYYFNNYRSNDGKPDFVKIANMFYRESGCRATKRCLAY